MFLLLQEKNIWTLFSKILFTESNFNELKTQDDNSVIAVFILNIFLHD